MLSSLLQTEPKTARELTDEQMIDLLITIVNSGYETVSTTSMMAVKYLHDHPRALQEIRVRNPLDLHWNSITRWIFISC